MRTTVTTVTGSRYTFEDGQCIVVRKNGHHMGNDAFPSVGFRTLRNSSDQCYGMVFDSNGNIHLYTSIFVTVEVDMSVEPCDCGCHLPGLEPMEEGPCCGCSIEVAR